MLCHRDVPPYLLAIKSLYFRVGHGRVVIINDSSLTPDDLTILQSHIPGIVVLDIAGISTGSCPRGGTWERLVKILELSAETYVIQTDADILVSGPIPEVIQSVRENRSFLLGTGAGKEVTTALDTARMVQGWIKTNNWNPIKIGIEAEAALDRLSSPEEKILRARLFRFCRFCTRHVRYGRSGMLLRQYESVIGLATLEWVGNRADWIKLHSRKCPRRNSVAFSSLSVL